MSISTYHFGKIYEAISHPKGTHASCLIDYHIEIILDDFKDSDNIEAMNEIALKINDYVKKNLKSKFETRKYARQLVREWQQLCGKRH